MAMKNQGPTVNEITDGIMETIKKEYQKKTGLSEKTTTLNKFKKELDKKFKDEEVKKKKKISVGDCCNLVEDIQEISYLGVNNSVFEQSPKEYFSTQYRNYADNEYLKMYDGDKNEIKEKLKKKVDNYTNEVSKKFDKMLEKLFEQTTIRFKIIKNTICKLPKIKKKNNNTKAIKKYLTETTEKLQGVVKSLRNSQNKYSCSSSSCSKKKLNKWEITRDNLYEEFTNPINKISNIKTDLDRICGSIKAIESALCQMEEELGKIHEKQKYNLDDLETCIENLKKQKENIQNANEDIEHNCEDVPNTEVTKWGNNVINKLDDHIKKYTEDLRHNEPLNQAATIFNNIFTKIKKKVKDIEIEANTYCKMRWASSSGIGEYLTKLEREETTLEVFKKPLKSGNMEELVTLLKPGNMKALEKEQKSAFQYLEWECFKVFQEELVNQHAKLQGTRAVMITYPECVAYFKTILENLQKIRKKNKKITNDAMIKAEKELQNCLDLIENTKLEIKKAFEEKKKKLKELKEQEEKKRREAEEEKKKEQEEKKRREAEEEKKKKLETPEKSEILETPETKQEQKTPGTGQGQSQSSPQDTGASRVKYFIIPIFGVVIVIVIVYYYKKRTQLSHRKKNLVKSQNSVTA
jgi:hypothetical protein